MEVTYTDSVFGEMKYKHRWYKIEKCALFHKEWDITVAAKAYSGKPITDAQRESYARYKANEKEIAQTVAEVITDYVNTNCNELAETWMGARMVSSVSDLADIVTPKTLLFTQTGDALLLLDCAWDIEHGLGVQIFPEYKIGSQDCFL